MEQSKLIFDFSSYLKVGIYYIKFSKNNNPASKI